MSAAFLNNVFVIVTVLLLCLVLFHPRVIGSSKWRATVTPLASIIGSGFLVLGPILLRNFGHAAVLVMAALCLLSYAIGGAIRFNITALARPKSASHWTHCNDRLERGASWALVFAYIISVCYYINLFGAFAVSLTNAGDRLHARMVSTAVLVFIGALGWLRGLRGLERAEELSVALKLSVIGGLLIGMTLYSMELFRGVGLAQNATHLQVDSWRVAIGLLITVQGFETSRYLSQGYDAQTRIQSMRWAQWLSSGIYVAYIGLAGVVFSATSINARETAIIQMTEQVAPILPVLLVAAALAAQFSAAVADTNGCGGLAFETSAGKVKAKVAYAGLAVFGVALTWLANIYEIIEYASRAFALYYAIQCSQSTLLSWRAARWTPRSIGFALLTIVSLTIAVFGAAPE